MTMFIAIILLPKLNYIYYYPPSVTTYDVPYYSVYYMLYLLAILFHRSSTLINLIYVLEVLFILFFPAFIHILITLIQRLLLMNNPFFLVDVHIGSFLVLLRSSFSTPSTTLAAFSGCSKHTILGSIRIISQLISFEFLNISQLSINTFFIE